MSGDTSTEVVSWRRKNGRRAISMVADGCCPNQLGRVLSSTSKTNMKIVCDSLRRPRRKTFSISKSRSCASLTRRKSINSHTENQITQRSNKPCVVCGAASLVVARTTVSKAPTHQLSNARWVVALTQAVNRIFGIHLEIIERSFCPWCMTNSLSSAPKDLEMTWLDRLLTPFDGPLRK